MRWLDGITDSVAKSTSPPFFRQLCVYDGPDRATVDSGNSFPTQEVRPGGSTAKPMRVCRGN